MVNVSKKITPNHIEFPKWPSPSHKGLGWIQPIFLAMKNAMIFLLNICVFWSCLVLIFWKYPFSDMPSLDIFVWIWDYIWICPFLKSIIWLYLFYLICLVLDLFMLIISILDCSTLQYGIRTSLFWLCSLWTRIIDSYTFSFYEINKNLGWILTY